MITRLLPREEWARLAGTELETVYPVLPQGSHVIVIEDDGRIVGCWAVYPQWHVHGVWIAESHRKRASVPRRLLRAMRSVAQALGAQAVVTSALDPAVATMLKNLGAVELEGRHFSLKVRA